jgi:hypothetical protein
MPSKKKPRPLFEVPAEVESGHESGWVYRSNAGDHPPRSDEEATAPADPGIAAASATTVALALAALAQTFVLSMTIAAIPWTMSIRALQSLAKPDQTGSGR